MLWCLVLFIMVLSSFWRLLWFFIVICWVGLFLSSCVFFSIMDMVIVLLCKFVLFRLNLLMDFKIWFVDCFNMLICLLIFRLCICFISVYFCWWIWLIILCIWVIGSLVFFVIFFVVVFGFFVNVIKIFKYCVWLVL